MDESIVSQIASLREQASSNPTTAMQSLAEIAEQCGRRGQSEEQAFALINAVRIGTTPSLAQLAVEYCNSLIQVDPRLIYVRHLVFLYEMCGQAVRARGILLWIAKLAIDRGIDRVTSEDVRSLSMGTTSRVTFQATEESERQIEMLLSLSRICVIRGELDGALRAAESALGLKPGNPEAVMQREELLKLMGKL
jgi:hypothetical protein